MAPMRHWGSRLGLLLVLLAGCASVPLQTESRVPTGVCRGIVLVLPGAGGNDRAATLIADAVAERGLSLYVRSFDWTHGGLGLADVTDAPYARCQGRQLAQQILSYRQTCPNLPIYVVGYSAGTAAALAAADWLPANTLERILLLAPAVSACYDLSKPLASARSGVDVFYSERDRFWLGLGIGLVGTTDGKQGPAAGRVGFGFAALANCDPVLAARLRQYPWTEQVAWTRNEGEHSGSLRPIYLKTYVVPLLNPPQ
jgi:pimeloyl-ACP methyl ester carboxylesterase